MKQYPEKLSLQQENLRNLTSLETERSNPGGQFVTNVPVCPTCSLALGKRQ